MDETSFSAAELAARARVLVGLSLEGIGEAIAGGRLSLAFLVPGRPGRLRADRVRAAQGRDRPGALHRAARRGA